ncbi:polysaccharide pyruvyl transferase family protein [Streptomyces acidiscabies]|uniref:Polysaccharide pyruvyl transferase family protein n=1 Tax=Streptomyces acidiscabies TaxID=42234 RepID=A0AAP6EGH9_9ACTN|nr:polysaccharide pyruvyl transferase family protein [Streptomyces acidiscabies]MBP5935138.1 polysaccharide pyruvyl transferase family protein [Streptomyces sp. LBUM 1476]MBZ3917057.1 polysaccharide pyruvyl transferase family protein [Streptomyces acidiscabies]MDX2961296.1 polysaccharide pyruvyl transferase family protein [Streptomyces acidiscabies]MDX3022654.1 polysaccharide pyruvyl transferase family protein [Streptomyces acidiscabies]MDX3792018.1 polysaccharide pyruvyl transferase family pr
MTGAHYLVCPAGIPNYGDEVIAATWLRHLAGTAPATDVVVDCLYPETAAAHLDGIHPRARFTNTLWNLCLSLWPEDDPAVVCAWVTDAVRDPGLADLYGAQVIHLAGGGYLNAIWPYFAGLPAGIVTVAEASGARTAATGQGLWPPADDSGLTRSFLDRFDVVDVRDAASAEFAGLAPQDAYCDDVFLGMGPQLLRTEGEMPEVMVSVQSLLADNSPEDTARYVAEVLRSWDATDVGLLECSPEKDRDVLDAVEKEVPGVRRYGLDDVLANGLPARAGQRWLGTRFHPHLVAAAAGAYGVGLVVGDGYYGTKHQSLIDAGSGWGLVRVPEIPPPPDSGGFSGDRLAELRAAKLAVAERVYGRS